WGRGCDGSAEGVGDLTRGAEAGEGRHYAPEDRKCFCSGNDGGEVADALLRGGVAVRRVASAVFYQLSIGRGMGEGQCGPGEQRDADGSLRSRIFGGWRAVNRIQHRRLRLSRRDEPPRERRYCSYALL